MHGRPYHPQSQGRVERFNRTLTDYFRIKMAENKNWVDNLQEFYYTYNNRLNKATRPNTPYQMFFKRPNFAAPLNDKVRNIQTITEGTELFLKKAHHNFIVKINKYDNMGLYELLPAIKSATKVYL